VIGSADDHALHPEFRAAVDRFLERETDAISHYMDELETPFRREPPPAIPAPDA